MKFPRNARIIRGQLDAAPFAGVLFCLLIFVLLCSLVYTPGVLIKLPTATTTQPGVDTPRISVALDANGNFFYQNQLIQESNLVKQLQLAASRQAEPLTLVVMADNNVTTTQWNHVGELAGSAGIHNIQMAVRQPLFDTAPERRKKP